MEQTSLTPTYADSLESRLPLPPTPRAERIANLLVWVVVALALLAGWLLKTYWVERPITYNGRGMDIPYPSAWVADKDEDGNPMLRDTLTGPVLFNNRVTLIQSDAPASSLPGSSPLVDAATAWSLKQSKSLTLFRNLATLESDPNTGKPLTLAGQPAIRIDYAYVADPAAELGQVGAPVLVRGSDYVTIAGNTLTVLSGQASSEEWERFEAQFTHIARGAKAAAGGS